MALSIYKNRSYDNNDASGVVALVDELLEKAVEAGASDVHFEPGLPKCLLNTGWTAF